MLTILPTKHKNRIKTFSDLQSLKNIPPPHSFSGSSWRDLLYQKTRIIQRGRIHGSQSMGNPQKKGQKNSQEEDKGSLVTTLWSTCIGPVVQTGAGEGWKVPNSIYAGGKNMN